MRVARRALAGAALLGAVALLFSRLLFIGLAPFIRDEPAFLMAAWQQLETGQLATHSPLAGTGNGTLRYGPTPLWFFGLSQWLLGPRADAAIAAVAIATCLSQLALIVALHRRLAPSSWWPTALVTAYTASLPYELFWSRLAWDLFTNFAPFLALALLASPRIGVVRATLLGLVCGLAISAHPMVTPFVGIVLSVLTFSRFAPLWRRLFTLAAVGGSLLVANLPWLAYLASARNGVLPARSPGVWHFAWGRALETFRPQSVWNISYFFDDDWAAFSHEHPQLAWASTQTLAVLVAALVTLCGLVLLLRRSDAPGVRRVALVGLLCALIYPVFCQGMQLERHPHYQFPVVWLGTAGAAGLFYARGLWALPLKALALGLAAVNLAFTVAWGQFVAARVGTRGIHYGTPVAEQLAFARAVCAAPPHSLRIRNETAIFSVALRQQLQAQPACRDKDYAVCKRPDCQGDTPNVYLTYREPEGGALAWRIEPSL